MGTLALAACGPEIGTKNDFQAQSFEVGRTTRDDVLGKLGLPQKILKDDDGREHLFYEGGPRYLGRIGLGAGIATGPGTIPPVANQAQIKQSAEYVFNSDGVLVAKHEPTKETRQQSQR
jgi:hypothetical protein